ncbi:winged helix-turn-helix transcriptional regulator [Amycolatopsis taiwanensis]|uniref:Transcriptional regulator n=1 Tax=Amycolatopsis taiwanensis TaxID=342230 RepID=A0A9W6R1Q9_9PSEU|nr:helix-turn-helix domain-containing protein [Amycolatopsis taiwanensis]GLY67559.1 transcriptional regulator [Amycolatopsis taiwanensis]
MAHQTVSYPKDGPLGTCLGPVVEPNPNCPVEITLAALRGRWTPLVLLEFLRNGELGFSELAGALPGLSDKVLSERLNQLTDAGIVERHRTPSWPPRVRYTLTERGRDLAPVLETLWSWGTAQNS